MTTQRKLSLAAAAVLLATSGVAAHAAGNLVTNGGFESGTFSGWTLAGNDVTAGTEGNLYGVEGTDPYPLPDGTAPHGGSSQAFFADQFADPTTLSQSIATTAGTTYTVSFYLAEATVGPGTQQASFTASFGGGGVIQSNIVDEAYGLHTFTGIATGASTTLSLTFGNDVGEYLIDDISVLGPPAPPPPPPPAIPEPSTLSLLGLGALMLAVRRKAQKKD